MKYIITITLLSLLNLLQAQNSSLSKQVDIFIEECKINKKELIYCNLLNEKYKTKVISSNDFIEINISKSDIENLESIVKYIENKYLNIMNPWVRKGVISICIKLIYCDSLKFQNSTKRKLVNICLNNSFLGTIISLKRVDKSYFNEIARNKLFDVLNQKYTKEEVIMDKLDDYRESVPADTLINNRIKNQYLKKAKKANLTVQEWCDSVNNDYKQKALNPDMNKYNPRISSSIITLIGNCHFTEYSQKLEEMLKNKEFSYLYDEILLVLAKLNYKNYSNLFFEKMIKREYKDEWEINKTVSELQYIGTQDAFFEMGKFIFIKNRAYCECEDRVNEFKPYGYKMLYTLSQFITNFPYKVFKHYDYTKLPVIVSYEDDCFCIQTDNLPENVLETAYEWMKANKGKYIIHKSFNIKR